MKEVLIISFFLFSLLTLPAQEPQLVLPAGHTGSINFAEFSPGGNYVITASADGTAKLWAVENGYLLRELKGHAATVDMAKFSPDGKYIVTVSNDNTAKIWETNSGKLLHTIKGITNPGQLGNGGIWISAGFSPDTKYLFTVSDATRDKGKIRIWTTANGRLVNTIQPPTGLLQPWLAPPLFTPDNKYILVMASNHTALKWDIKSGKQAGLLKNYTSSADSAHFTPDRKFFFTIERNDHSRAVSTTVSIKESQTGKTILTLPDTLSYTNHASFSPDGRMIVTGTDEQLANIWEVPSGRLLAKLNGHTRQAGIACFSRDNQFVLPNPEDSIALAWDWAAGKPVKEFNGTIYSIHSAFNRWAGDGDSIITYWNDRIPTTTRRKGGLAAAFFEVAEISPNSKYVVTAEGTWENVARLWDAGSGKLIRTLRGHTGVVSSAHFSEDGRMIITAASDDTARIWDTGSGKLLFKLDGHQAGIVTAAFNPRADKAITTSGDNSIKLWDIKAKKLLYTFFTLDNQDYFAKIPSGYYQGSAGATKLLHYVTPALQVITFEQLDVKYNRPDKVLEAIGNPDTALIKAYREAYYKRIKKLRIDTTAFRDGYSVPQAYFADRNVIRPEQTMDQLTLHIKGSDSSYPLDRFNVWVNEVPVYGQRGISIRKRNNNEFDSTITIKLSQGENRMETSLSNVNGTESYRMPLTINYIPGTVQKEMTRFIGIGIDQFADNQYNLQYSVKDIRDLSFKLKEKYGAAIIIDTLFNENVTLKNVKALKQQLQQTTENDKVIIAYSGHGLLSRGYDYYLSTFSVNFVNPEQDGLPYDELENLLDSIPARKKLLLIDACHSGEVDKEDLVTLDGSPDSLIKGLKPVAYKKAGHLGLKNSFELMQSLFVNVGKSTGATIISAAAGTQFALERNDLENGVFTYAILEAMKNNPSLKISELKKLVIERVAQLTNGLQKPTSRNEMIATDWTVW